MDVDVVELPNGQRTELEIVHHPGGAAVVAIDEKDRLCLLRQYRYAASGWLWELPAGKIDAKESPLATAQRELAQEARIRAACWISLGCILSSPGVFTESIHLFLAHELSCEPGGEPEAHEVIEVHWLTLDKALTWASSGRILDAKTLVALYRAQAHLRYGP